MRRERRAFYQLLQLPETPAAPFVSYVRGRITSASKRTYPTESAPP
jgi:hypothetical protein